MLWCVSSDDGTIKKWMDNAAAGSMLGGFEVVLQKQQFQ